MRKRIVPALLVAVWTLTGVVGAHATGFSIYEAGSRATALGGAFTARADDGSALFYNAAGLSFLEGRAVDLNGIAIAPNFKFAGQLSKTDALARGESESQTFLVPGVYYTSNTGKKLSWGAGVYAPFGLGVKWQDGDKWIGRRISHDVSIETVYITPALSYMAADGLALAIGLDVAHQKLNLKKYTPHPTTGENAVHTELDGSSSWNVSPSFGVMYRPDEKWSFGFMYHFKKTMKFDEGEATLVNAMGAPTSTTDPANWPASLIAGLGGSKQKLSTEVELPYIMSLGARYRFHERFDLEANYVRFGWSSLEGLDLNFANDNLDQVIHLGYENSWQLRLGAEYMAKRDKIFIMAGYVRDNTPQPLVSVSPLLPDSDRNDYSVGLLFKFGNWDVNASYMAVIGEERTNIEGGEPVRNTSDYPFGSYGANANLFGLGVAYHF
jgi:long-chain fatty acid transport protein